MNRFRFVLLFCLCFIFLLLSSIKVILATNGLDYKWGYLLGGTGIDIGATFTDSNGNVYLTGSYSATVDFDPTSTVENHTSNGGYDMFISKYSSDGTYYWTKVWGGTGASDTVYRLLWDNSNNMYVFGEFMNTVDFDSGSSTDNKTSTGSTDIFVTKYSSDATYQWTKIWGGTGADRSTGGNIDSAGNYYFTGAYRNTVDFNPDSGATDNKTSNGNYDVYLVKFNSDWSYGWVKTWGGSSFDYAEEIFVDNNGGLIIIGEFMTTVNFNPEGVTDNRTSLGRYDCYIRKYNSDGNYLWTKIWGGTGDEMCFSITIDSKNNYYLGGYAGGLDPSTTIDLDAGSGIDTRTLSGLGDNMIIKFDLDGNYVWGKTFGTSEYDFTASVSLDQSNYLYAFGVFNGTVDFDTGDSTNYISSHGLKDFFLSKYDLDGNYKWTKIFGGTLSEATNWPDHMEINGDSMYLSLIVASNLNLNPDGGTETTNYAGSYDMTLAKFEIDNTAPNDFTLISPKDYITNTAPTLIFGKSSDMNGISSYDVYFDPEKYINYSISGIPSSGNGTSNYAWLDDVDRKVEFVNEDDLDTTNDQIKVYFKALAQNPLVEGAHVWKVIATDGQSNKKTMRIDFALDQTNLNVSNLFLAGVGNIKEDRTYKLISKNNILNFSGKISDPYIETTKINSNGTIDNFNKASSGPDSVKLTIKKLTKPKNYEAYLTKTYTFDEITDVVNVEKYKDFNIVSPISLKGGFYQIYLEFKDKAGNIYSLLPFYLNISQTTPKVYDVNTENVVVSPTSSSPTPSLNLETPQTKYLNNLLEFFKKVLQFFR